MNFGNNYQVAMDKMGIKKNEVKSITEKRTYKKFIEVTINYEQDGIEKEYKFKTIKSNLQSEDL